ncbi:MAG: OmpA family protein [Acidobacteriota bacterium]|nr:OmpA family protein [Acidobacteriota bacterium]
MFVNQRFFRLALLALAAAVMTPSAMWAQKDDSRIDVFAGYSFLHPGGTIAQTPLDGLAPTKANSIKLDDLKKGFGIDGTYKFKPWFGLKAAVNGHYSDPADFHMVMGGPVFILPLDHVSFFGEALGGISHVSPAGGLHSGTAGAAALGGGMDLWLTKHWAWRVIQADYIYQNQAPSNIGGAGDFNGARIQSGIVYGFGSFAAKTAPAAACSVTPSEVLVGETVTVSASGSNFNPKHTVAYAWSGAGVKSMSSSATIATADLAPGTYKVNATITDTKDAKASAGCSASFLVKPLPPKNPPVASASASPASSVVGTPVKIAVSCSSPDGVPVSVSGWTATSGTINGSGNYATVDTTNVAPGNVTVDATCTDARGLSTQASTSFAVEAAPAPVIDRKLEARLSLHSVYFVTAKPTVKEPTVGLLKSQEKTLSTLAADFKAYSESNPSAHLILEGHADVRGSAAYNQSLTERRTAIVKSYLVQHGVPESVIETRPLGAAHNLTAAQVKESVEEDKDLSAAEKTRILKNEKVIIWASNRRVDVTLKATGMSETSVRKFPFNGADSLTLLGAEKAPAHKKAVKK